MSSDESVLATALTYFLDFNLAVIPIVPCTKKPPARFRLKRYFDQPPTERAVRRWFTKYHDHSIAVLLGDVSDGLVVRDFDDMDAYERWAKREPGLAATLPTVATPRPGRHVFCTTTVADVYREFDGTKIIKHGDGEGELRAGDGYVLLPPSVHPSGQRYEWIIEPSEFPNIGDLRAAGLLTVPPRIATKKKNETQCRGGEGSGGELEQRSRKPQVQTTKSSLYIPSLPSVFNHEITDLTDLTVEKAIELSRPSEYGERNQRVFQLCRLLKAIPKLRRADLNRLQPIVRRWHKLALPRIRTKDFAETWADFVTGWENVERPFRTSDIEMPPMTYFVDRAKGVGIDFLDSLCYEMQCYVGDRPVHLDCQTATDCIGKRTKNRKPAKKSTVAKWFLKLMATERIAEVRYGDYRNGQSREFYHLDYGDNRQRRGVEGAPPKLQPVLRDYLDAVALAAAGKPLEGNWFPGRDEPPGLA
jgi:hypothetical protein